MADKIQLTDDLDLGPGVTVTPGHEVNKAPDARPANSDRRIFYHTNPDGSARVEIEDVAILSTHKGVSPATDGASVPPPAPATTYTPPKV